ncbi:MAG TPA: hypothetical protein VF149_06640, partial [Bacillales bacterium]
MKNMDVERGFKTVLDQFKMPGSAMYVLFDENRTHLVGIERGLIPAGFRDSLHECGSSMQMQDKAIAAGGCFTMVPLSDFPEGGYIGAVFFEHDLSKDHMAERLIEVRGMMRWAAGEEETVNQYKLLYEITKKFYSSMDV